VNGLAIRVENLSKQFTIGAQGPGYRTLRDQIAATTRSLLRRGGEAPRTETFWALDDVSFDVRHGEVIGIIGRNGAGKSTLLKILSRITEPTKGRADLYGRIGALLEVGTGFHQELSGRENIYLSGVLLGMKTAEVESQFDEIVAFAGVEKFIDTPVKHYSSGMYVRLAFAVAAHLRPEILIVDEVLAVGDAGFQAKCLGKMGEVARDGRTILFVSHNMGAVSNLCTSAIWLDEGRVVMNDTVDATVSAYIKSMTAISHSDTKNWRRQGSGEARITAASLLDSVGNPCTTFAMGETLVVEFDVEFHRPLVNANLTIEVNRMDLAIRIMHLDSHDAGFVLDNISPGKRRFRVEIPHCVLYPALYKMFLCVWDTATIYDYVAEVLSFSMVEGAVSRRTLPLSLHKQAIFYQPSLWHDIP
jgi:lipopolysaccharide transport system ATP-binding protein